MSKQMPPPAPPAHAPESLDIARVPGATPRLRPSALGPGPLVQPRLRRCPAG